MQVVIHAGAHMTDDDRLVQCLLENKERLSAIGTDVPDPRVYRKLLRDILNAAMKSGINDEARDIVLDTINHDPAADRLILSNQGFFGTQKMAVGQGQLYPQAAARMEAFRQIFPNDDIEFFVGLRDLATFFPAILPKTPFETMEDMLNGVDPSAFRWTDMVRRLREAHPDMPMTIWCNEDTPLIWGQVVRELAGLDPNASFQGEYMLLKEIMTEEGIQRFETYMASQPNMTEIQKRRVIVAFLDKFVKEEEIEEELDLPGWSEELIDRLSEIYDEDVFEVARVSGVNMIAP